MRGVRALGRIVPISLSSASTCWVRLFAGLCDCGLGSLAFGVGLVGLVGYNLDGLWLNSFLYFLSLCGFEMFHEQLPHFCLAEGLWDSIDT